MHHTCKILNHCGCSPTTPYREIHPILQIFRQSHVSVLLYQDHIHQVHPWVSKYQSSKIEVEIAVHSFICYSCWKPKNMWNKWAERGHRPQCVYTQYPIIRNGLIRNSAESLWKFNKLALGRSILRNASKNLENSDFQS